MASLCPLSNFPLLASSSASLATPATHPFNHVKNKIWVPEFARRWRGGLQIGPRAGNLNSSDALLVSGSSGMNLHGGW